LLRDRLDRACIRLYGIGSSTKEMLHMSLRSCRDLVTFTGAISFQL